MSMPTCQSESATTPAETEGTLLHPTARPTLPEEAIRSQEPSRAVPAGPGQGPWTYTFTLNGQEVGSNDDKTMLRFLRDDMGIRSVKDGCAQGACGACVIIVDGKSVRACVLTTKKAVGRNIQTIEGFTEAQKEAFVYAFGAKGSVQCGFCIPGMVVASKALLDKNTHPTEDDIKLALKNNLCRCTGYKKIIEGVQLTAAILRGEETIDPDLEKGKDYGVGARAFRIDVREKVLGFGEYPDDIYLEGMLHASAVRSKYPRARVLKIDASKALAMEGVVDVLTWKDVPVNKVGHITPDWDVMIPEGAVTHMLGDTIAVVVAETLEILEKAKKAVRVDYEELKPITSIQEALAPDAELVHIHNKDNMCCTRHVTRGDAKTALANSKFVVTHHYTTPFTEHAFIEPECAISFPYKDGIKIWDTSQGVYDVRHEVAHMFGWEGEEMERIIVENKLVGGGFGGKEDVSAQHLTALAAYKLQRPVKMKFSREESLMFHPKRHAMEGTLTLGCDENGIFTGLDCDIYFDGGAYASLGGPVLERACTHAVGPYCYQDTDIRGYSLYTNNPPGGAFRGFGVCQTQFGLEQNINLLAEMVGISPWEIRYRNAIEPGAVLPNGQIADVSTALKETLEAVKDVYEANADHAGIACSMKNAGTGVGLPDKGRAKLIVQNGKVEIYAAASDIGQGCKTVFIQQVCEATGLTREDVINKGCNSEVAPDSGTTSGSRQTLLTGEAIRVAAMKLADALKLVDGDISKLEGQGFFHEYFERTDKLGADVPNPKSHIAYGYATHVVVLDPKGRVSDVYAAHDSGKVVNPISIQGQIEGGVLMGMGYALTEDWKLDKCVPPSKFGTLGLMRATDIPNIHAIYVEKNKLLEVAYGSKGIGEIATIPTAPAAAGAYYAMDHQLRTSLPMQDTFYSTPQKDFSQPRKPQD